MAFKRLKEKHLAYKHIQNQIEKEAEFLSYLFEANGLPALALQGLSLFEIYDIPGVRPMGDLDLLVKSSQRDQVIPILKAIGYSVPNPVYPNNLIKNGMWLDIHTHILNLDRIESRKHIFPNNLSSLWNRAVAMFPSTKGLLKPDPIDNIILLAAHTLKHGYSRMIWLTDLYESITKYVAVPDKWDQLIERTQYWEQEKPVLYGLIVLEGTLGQRVPLSVKRGLGYDKLGVFEKRTLKLNIKGVPLPGYGIVLWFFAIKGIRKKIEFTIETMFPRNDIMSQIGLDSNVESRILSRRNRFLKTLSMVGNGVKQALLHGPLGRH
jgi:hypothetical protein